MPASYHSLGPCVIFYLFPVTCISCF